MTNIITSLNANELQFVLLGGLMGSGKSTLVEQLEQNGFKVVCPDRIRVEFARKEPGNEDKLEGELVDILMNYENKVWAVAHSRVKKYLADGKSVVFDATMLNPKARKPMIQLAKGCGVQAVAVYLECPLELAQQRNLERSKKVVGKSKNGGSVFGRYVPNHIIELKSLSQILPTIEEGFAKVHIIHVGLEEQKIKNGISTLRAIQCSDIEQSLKDLHECGALKTLLPSFDKCWEIDQENKHHNVLLHQHMINAAKYLQNESFELFVAGLLHDVGKFDTKKKYGKILADTKIFKEGEKVEIKNIREYEGFINAYKLDYKGERSELLTVKHVELDPDAHYYEHHVIGAILARRDLIALGFDEDLANQVYKYVLYHMDIPFQQITNKKQIETLVNKIGAHNMNPLVKLREADKSSSNGDVYFEKIHSDNVKFINEVVEEIYIREHLKLILEELISLGKTKLEAQEIIHKTNCYEQLHGELALHDSPHNWALGLLTKIEDFETLEKYYGRNKND